MFQTSNPQFRGREVGFPLPLPTSNVSRRLHEDREAASTPPSGAIRAVISFVTEVVRRRLANRGSADWREALQSRLDLTGNDASGNWREETTLLNFELALSPQYLDTPALTARNLTAHTHTCRRTAHTPRTTRAHTHALFLPLLHTLTHTYTYTHTHAHTRTQTYLHLGSTAHRAYTCALHWCIKAAFFLSCLVH